MEGTGEEERREVEEEAEEEEGIALTEDERIDGDTADAMALGDCEPNEKNAEREEPDKLCWWCAFSSFAFSLCSFSAAVLAT